MTNDQRSTTHSQGPTTTFTGPIASQYPGFFSYVVQYTVRRALYLKGNRAAAGPENQSEK